jgi:hypothetical protein
VCLYASARLSRMEQVTYAGVSGTSSPLSRHTCATREGMSPGGQKTASLGSKTLRSGSSPAAAETSSSMVLDAPLCYQVFTDFCRSHRHITVGW